MPVPRLIIALFSTTIPAFAWHSPMIRNVCNSAPDPGGTVVVNVDVTGPHTDQVSAKLFYPAGSQQLTAV